MQEIVRHCLKHLDVLEEIVVIGHRDVLKFVRGLGLDLDLLFAKVEHGIIVELSFDLGVENVLGGGVGVSRGGVGVREGGGVRVAEGDSEDEEDSGGGGGAPSASGVGGGGVSSTGGVDVGGGGGIGEAGAGRASVALDLVA